MTSGSGSSGSSGFVCSFGFVFIISGRREVAGGGVISWIPREVRRIELAAGALYGSGGVVELDTCAME